MTLRRAVVLGGLAGLGALIWLRVPLGERAGDLLPALAAFPLYGWLVQPWVWREQRGGDRLGVWGGATGVLVLGAALDHTLILAVGWVLLWRAWLTTEMEVGARAVHVKPLLLLLCGFPWLGVEGQALGWWFRYSGAWAAEGFFGAVGLAVTREGTFLNVQGLPLAVDAACSGLHALQAMLVAGILMALLVLPGRRFWWGVALLPLLAWVANVLRIVTLGVAGLSYGPEAAMGWFHDWGGWAVLMVMFALCTAVFQVMARVATAPAERAVV